MATVSLKHIFKKYSGTVTAVSDFSLEIEDGSFFMLAGPSGCGKSTLLRMIAGLEEISGGELYIDGRLMNGVDPREREIALVLQDYALYPQKTVYENMAGGLRLRRLPDDEVRCRVDEAADLLGITHLIERKAGALSSGQKQRVALGRALARKPKLILFDEPLLNLDEKQRARMGAELLALHKKLGMTFICVTHDQGEVMAMGGRTAIMKDGVIQQVDTPRNLYEKPCNVFVAGFMGSPQMNFIDARLAFKNGGAFVLLSQAGEDFDGGEVGLRIPDGRPGGAGLKEYDGRDVILGIRPEDIHDETASGKDLGGNVMETRIDGVGPTSGEASLILAGQPVIARVSLGTFAKEGDPLNVTLDAGRAHLFDKDTERAILN